MPANMENSAVVTGLERSVFIPIPKKGNAQECLHYHKIMLISHASKEMLKIRQASTVCEPWTSRCSSWILKRLGITDQIANIHWIIEKAKEFQKNIYFCFTDYSESESEVAQSCATVCDPMNPGVSSSIIGIFQARVLEWIAISFSRGIFPTQESNPGLLNCRQTFLLSKPPGKSER